MHSEEPTSFTYFFGLVVLVVSDQHLPVTTRCHRWDGGRIVSKPRHNMAHLLQLFHCFTKPRSAHHYPKRDSKHPCHVTTAKWSIGVFHRCFNRWHESAFDWQGREHTIAHQYKGEVNASWPRGFLWEEFDFEIADFWWYRDIYSAICLVIFRLTFKFTHWRLETEYT